MVRLAILAALIALSIWEWLQGPNKALYLLTAVGLFAFFSLRYGQGQDYLNYLSIYQTVKPLQMLPSFFEYSFNKIDIGFFYLVSLCRMLHIHFSLFIVILTGGSLLLVDRFIRKFSPLPMLSLTIFFAVYSITYMESGLRQLIALCMMLGWALPDWHQGRRVRSAVVILIAAAMHSSAILLLAILPVFFYHEQQASFNWNRPRAYILMACAIAASVAINFIPLQPIFSLTPWGPVLNYYYLTTRNFNILALTNRALFALIVCALAFRARDRLSSREWFLFKLYLIGFFIYLLFMSIDLIASRTNVYFRIVELALLPALMYRNRDLGNKLVPALAGLLAIVAFIYVKDIGAVMSFGQYFKSSPLDYPYVTIINPAELMDARYIPVKFEPYMNQSAYGEFDFDEYYRKVTRKPSLNAPYLPY
ncbi:MAG: EpsG family protein [Oscillospiraceae bacterium]|jgi:hypothetical protein|nr:EpsG family protein [Oscillospiraceae bacterium]